MLSWFKLWHFGHDFTLKIAGEPSPHLPCPTTTTTSTLFHLYCSHLSISQIDFSPPIPSLSWWETWGTGGQVPRPWWSQFSTSKLRNSGWQQGLTRSGSQLDSAAAGRGMVPKGRSLRSATPKDTRPKRHQNQKANTMPKCHRGRKWSSQTHSN